MLSLWRCPLYGSPKAEGRGRHIYDKGVYCALCLTLGNFATFWYSQEHGNSDALRDVLCARPFCLCTLVRRRIDATFISGVGFRVARSTVPGNAKASKCGTSDGENSHAFLYMYVSINFLFSCLWVFAGLLQTKRVWKLYGKLRLNSFKKE